VPQLKKATLIPREFGYSGAMEVFLFPGNSNEFQLYEDSGEHMDFSKEKEPQHCLRTLSLEWKPAKRSESTLLPTFPRVSEMDWSNSF